MSTRRGFMQASITGLVTLVAGRAEALTPRSSQSGQPLEEFDYSQVSFEPGLQETQLEHTHEVIMSISEDSMLRPFRQAAGLPAPGGDLVGDWYRWGGGFGQWISGLARYYAITGDAATREKVNRLVEEFIKTIEPSGKIYEQGMPAYNYDKFTCALLEADRITRSPIALDALARTTDAVVPHLPPKAAENMKGGWSLVLPENQFVAYERTRREIHQTLAIRHLAHEYLDPLARGENVLPGRHACDHVDALSSALKAYLVLGERRYLDAARNAFDFITAQSFATGAWGPNEVFIPSKEAWGGEKYGDEPPKGWLPEIRTLAEALRASHWHFDTVCGAYSHMRLTRYLLRITRQSAYGDSMERIMYNTVLGVKPLLQNGLSFFQSDYNPDGHKIYNNSYGFAMASEWSCCSYTLLQAAADYRINTYLRDARGVYVNLYIPSTLKWQQGDAHVTLTQASTYPLGSHIVVTIDTTSAAYFDLHLRMPGWAHGASVTVNDKQVAVPVQPGSFLPLSRTWRSGDRIEIDLPMRIELKAIDETEPNTVAVMHGPLVLFAVTTQAPRLTRQQLLAAKRQHKDAAEWYVESNESRVRFRPFWAIDDERYSTYLSLT